MKMVTQQRQLFVALYFVLAISLEGCCAGGRCEFTTRPRLIAGTRDLLQIRDLPGIQDGLTGLRNHDRIERNYFEVQINGIDGVKAVQQRPEWCWVAAVSMTMNYQGIPLSQCDVIKSLGKDCNSNDLQFGTISSIVGALNGFRVNRRGRAAFVQATSLLTANGFPLIEDIATNWPPIVGLKSETDGAPGHVYILLEVTYSWYPNTWNVPVFWRTKLYDPWNGNTVRMSGDEFKERLDFAVRMRVAHN